MLFSTLSLEAMESCLVCEFRGNRTELIHHLRSRHGDLKNQKEFPGFVKDGDIISKDGRYLCLNCMIPRFAKKHKCFGMPEIPRPPPQEDTDSDTSESDIEAIAAPTDYKTMVAQQAKEIARLQAALDAKTSKRRVKKRIVEVLASDSETSEEEVTVVRRKAAGPAPAAASEARQAGPRLLLMDSLTERR